MSCETLMEGHMRHLKAVALALILVAAACGGGDDDGAGGGGGGGDAGSGNDPSIMSTNFDVDALPANFPSELVPPSWTAGQATDLLGPFVVNFESDMEFTDAVAYYEAIFGPVSVVGDPGEQLAQWTGDPTWIVSILDGDPVLIGFTDITE